MLSDRLSATAPSILAVLIVLLSAAACDRDRDEDDFDSRSTDIVLLEVSSFGGLVASGDPLWITDRDGYDNQPAFTADGRSVLFTSQHGLQADIHRYDIENDDRDAVALTLESEFSPRPLPEGSGFACVRVEQDGRQRLWTFDPAADEAPRLLLPTPDYVGYFALADDGAMAVYVLGREPVLFWFPPEGEPRKVADAVGRSIQTVPGLGGFSYSVDDDSGQAWIHRIDPTTGRGHPLVPALPGSLDHAWLPDGTLLMGRGSILYAAYPLDEGFDSAAGAAEPDGPWSPWLDLSRTEIEGITRIAVSPDADRLALVVRH